MIHTSVSALARCALSSCATHTTLTLLPSARLLLEKTQQILPYIYTPTVGEACQKYHTLPIKTHGLYLDISKDKGKILQRLKVWRLAVCPNCIRPAHAL